MSDDDFDCSDNLSLLHSKSTHSSDREESYDCNTYVQQSSFDDSSDDDHLPHHGKAPTAVESSAIQEHLASKRGFHFGIEEYVIRKNEDPEAYEQMQLLNAFNWHQQRAASPSAEEIAEAKKQKAVDSNARRQRRFRRKHKKQQSMDWIFQDNTIDALPSNKQSTAMDRTQASADEEEVVEPKRKRGRPRGSATKPRQVHLKKSLPNPNPKRRVCFLDTHHFK